MIIQNSEKRPKLDTLVFCVFFLICFRHSFLCTSFESQSLNKKKLFIFLFTGSRRLHNFAEKNGIIEQKVNFHNKPKIFNYMSSVINHICILQQFFIDWTSNIQFYFSVQFSSVAQSCLTLCDHMNQHARPPCPSPTPRVHSDSHLSSQ